MSNMVALACTSPRSMLRTSKSRYVSMEIDDFQLPGFPSAKCKFPVAHTEVHVSPLRFPGLHCPRFQLLVSEFSACSQKVGGPAKYKRRTAVPEESGISAHVRICACVLYIYIYIYMYSV